LNELHEKNKLLLRKNGAMEEEIECLSDENEQLKESVYSWSKSYNRVYEENEQLKHQLQQQEMENATTCNRLAEENEQLKKQLNAFKPIVFEDANNEGSSILYEKVKE